MTREYPTTLHLGEALERVAAAHADLNVLHRVTAEAAYADHQAARTRAAEDAPLAAHERDGG